MKFKYLNDGEYYNEDEMYNIAEEESGDTCLDILSEFNPYEIWNHLDESFKGVILDAALDRFIYENFVEVDENEENEE